MKSDSLPIFSNAKAAANQPQGWPVLRLGFRPFYLGGSLVAALAVPLWLAMFLGGVQMNAAVPALLWHAHEMLFGFAIAIIIGFLMTAGKNWTGLPTPRGPALGALALLWLSARVAALTGPYPLFALLDVALLPLVAAIFARLLLRAKNYRNLPLALILLLLALANATFHLNTLGMLNIASLTPLHATLALITLIQTVIAGRVIPMFTMSVIPGLQLQVSPLQERLMLGFTILGLLLWLFAPAGIGGLLVLLAAASLHAKRWWAWQPWLTRSQPILWVLHAAYLWIALGLLLLGLAQMGWLPVSTGVHALAVGATGGLIIGMLTRTARGHTGRPIAASHLEVIAYALVAAAAVMRVLLPLLLPGFYTASLVLAGIAWSMAFLIYLWVFAPWLMRTRLDGKDG